MARSLRIKFPGAIYHVMARGNARQALFHGDDDYQTYAVWLGEDGAANGLGSSFLCLDAESHPPPFQNANAKTIEGYAVPAERLCQLVRPTTSSNGSSFSREIPWRVDRR